MNSGHRWTWRWLLTSICSLACVAAMVYAAWKWRESRRAPVEMIPFNDVVKAAITLRLDTAKSLFQVALLVFAALWGLLFAKKEAARIVFSDTPELVLFGLGNVVLLLSLGSYLAYALELSVIQGDAGVIAEKLKQDPSLPKQQTETPLIPDVFGDRIDYHLFSQICFLVTGCFATTLTFASATFFKETQ
jgi:hypothetical protein